LTVFNVRVEGLVTVLALDEADFVGPPLNALPVRLIVFQEDLVVVGVFSETENNIFWWSSLRPLNRLECEHLQGLGDVHDCSLFGVFVLEVNASSGSITVVRHEVDTALGEVHEEHTRVQLLAYKVLKFRLWHVNQLNTERMDLDVNVNSLGHN
jgi:hypothetical protein